MDLVEAIGAPHEAVDDDVLRPARRGLTDDVAVTEARVHHLAVDLALPVDLLDAREVERLAVGGERRRLRSALFGERGVLAAAQDEDVPPEHERDRPTD